MAFDDAARELESIRHELRDHPAVLEVRWALAANSGNWQDALAIAVCLTQLMPSKAVGWIYQGSALVELSRHDDGYAVLLQAHERFPQDEIIAYDLACTVSCDRPGNAHWKDGNFKIYFSDLEFYATELGYDHHPGILGLVYAEVVAAGSTKQYVFAERTEPMSGRTEFYVIPKEPSAVFHSGTVEGPYSGAQFQEIPAARHLPEFSWRKRKG